MSRFSLSTTLPLPTGSHKVGMISIVRDMPPRKVGVAKDNDGEHVLEMDAIVWNVFYPCAPEKHNRSTSPWLDQPYEAAVSGISKFTGFSRFAVRPITWLYGSRLQMPVYPNAPLLRPDEGCQWRLALFSHGLAGSKTMYSQFCSNLASRGFVVLAPEHRDGSGMLFMSRAGEPQLYVAPKDIEFEEPDHDQMRLRVEQLEFRRLEIYNIFRTFREIVRGTATDVHQLDGGKVDLTMWRDRVDIDRDVAFTGHSFGGCTVLSTLSQPPPDDHEPLPVTQAVLLDPWFQPLSQPGPMPTSYKPQIPVCMLFSNQFAIWKSHHETAETLVKDWPAAASMFSLPQARHDTFSDMYALVPFQTKTYAPIFNVALRLSAAFLENRLDEELATVDTRNHNIISEKKKESTIRRLEGEAGQVVIY